MDNRKVLFPIPMSFSDRYNQLNDSQKHAVDTIDGPVMVVAGPGSGKTELLGMRVANILQKTDTPPSSILCITFTDAAAANMRKRLTGLIGQAAYDVSIHTFHSLGTEIIQQYSDYFYDGAEVLPADEIMTLQVITDILQTLPKGNPLASFHEEQGYVHARRVIRAISDIKRGGLTPDMLEEVIKDMIAFQEETNGYIQEFFAERVSKKMLDKVPMLVQRLNEAKHGALRLRPTMHTLKEKLLMDLKPVLEADKTTPLTEWKKLYTTKDDQNHTVWKELKQHATYQALVHVYRSYQDALKRKALVDFNDMLMRVVDVLQQHPDLRYTLQERYLYTMIDEFQDTNGVQMEMIRLLTLSDQQEHRPNILAVGDDDQAIYKFQGADLDNLLGFRDLFTDPAYIVLDKNYRSTQTVLDAAEEVIAGSEERLAHLMPETFAKNLQAANPKVQGGTISTHKAFSVDEEGLWIADQIQQLLAQGTSPEEIAVLGRNHAHLTPVATALLARQVPFIYDRSDNVLESNVVQELITMLELTQSLLQPRQTVRDDLLSTVLQYPCWNISSLTLWKISRQAFQERTSWMDILLNSEEGPLRHCALFFLEVAKRSQSEPIESIFDLLTGTHPITFIEEEEEITYHSPFKTTYFAQGHLDDKSIHLLAQLRGLLQAIRNYSPKKLLLAGEFLETLRLYQQYGIAIRADEQLLRRQQGLQLMTVHKAKGLEFDHVFIVHSTEKAWNKKGGGGGDIPLPKYLGLRAQPETESDFRKLFFVALTRARRFITLSYPAQDNKGKEMHPSRYLQATTMPEPEQIEISTEELLPTAELFPTINITREHKELLADILSDYTLSATHLNSFLDVSHGGPQQFMIDHVLRFPARKSPAASFGTAMHTAIERVYRYLREQKILPDTSYVEEAFEQALLKERLSDDERKKFLDHGKEQVRIFLEERGAFLDQDAIVERNFRNDHVHIGEAHITGKIDRMHIDKDTHTIEVCDWKTGKAMRSWNGRFEYEKRKAWAYKNQLMFYKLLVENSPQFRNKFIVNTGCLEFLEHREGKILSLSMDFSHEEMKRFATLLEIVYKKIASQDFLDTSAYSEDMKGILTFEEDLLGGL